MAFLVGMRLVTGMWPESGSGFLEGEWWMVAILAVGGLVVGLTRLWLHTPSSVNLFTELEEGRVDPRHVPGVVVTGFASLVSGASLGPEAPLGTMGGGAGTWVAERGNREARIESFAGMSAAFGGLIGLPLFGTALALELEHTKQFDYYRLVLPGLIASAIGSGVFYVVAADTFSGLYDLGTLTFEWWHFAAAIPLGALGAAIAIVSAVVFGVVRRVTARFAGHTVLLPVAGGTVMGLVAFAFPLTLFSGEHEFDVTLHEAGELGGWLLLGMALAKILCLATAMSTGFVGGPIFPLLFTGGTVGLCLSAAFPSLPVALTVSCVMAATPAAFATLPVSMLVVVLAILAGGAVAAPPSVAVVVAFSLTYGLGLFPPKARAAKEHAPEPAG